LTHRGWLDTKVKNKCIVRSSNVTKTIMETSLFDFLMDVVIDYCAYDVKQEEKVENLTNAHQQNAGNDFQRNKLNVAPKSIVNLKTTP